MIEIQECPITIELQSIYDAFNLGEYNTSDSPIVSAESQDGSIYYLRCGAIWRQTVSLHQDKIFYIHQQKFSQNINELATKIWYSHVSSKAYYYTLEIVKEYFAKKNPGEEVMRIHIVHPTRKSSFSRLGVEFFIHAPKSFLEIKNYGEIKSNFLKVFANQLSINKLKECIRFKNAFDEEVYNHNLRFWQRINDFILKNKINEKVGLEAPSSLQKPHDLYVPTMLDYHDYLP